MCSKDAEEHVHQVLAQADHIGRLGIRREREPHLQRQRRHKRVNVRQHGARIRLKDRVQLLERIHTGIADAHVPGTECANK